ncbi:hypothetical protein AB0I34_26435 [Kribbella sp. NPDC050281]|uniref:hypothetical protein n=1 Tax=Kribbella sp. NPDC050281 TaxID=3155515 RepID=UPI0033F18423
MSSLLRPVGHLPASVYWFRRGLVLVVLVLLFILVFRLFSGGGDDPQNSAASGPQQNPSSAPPPTPVTTPTATPTDTPAKSTPPPTPRDTNCEGSDVRVDVLPATRRIVSGSVLNFVVRLDAVSDGCKASVDPGRLTVTVTSGNDLIWTTTHCAQAIKRATLVVAKGKQATSTVAWNGHRSGPGCLPGQPVAKPGTYVVNAVFDGSPSSAQAFQVI